MAVTTTQPSPGVPVATEPIPVPVLRHALRPGIVLLEARAGAGAGEPRADDRALALLGCRDGAELAARWPAIRARLAAGGLRLAEPAGTAAAPGALGTGGAAGTPATPGTFAAPATPAAPEASAAPKAPATPAAPTPPGGEASTLAARAAVAELAPIAPVTTLEPLTASLDVELPPDLAGGRRIRVSPVFMDRAAATVATVATTATAATAATATTTALTAGDLAAAGDSRPAAPVALLLQDAELAAALESDQRAAAQMRSLAQITPAVAHDLRAPINAMVLNLEVLKETLAPPPGFLPGNPAHAAVGAAHPVSSPYGPPPAPAQRPGSAGRDPRERQQRYLAVLREELARLHQSLELFLAHISPRGERQETLDWRGPAEDLAALLRPPARKQQAQIELLLPDTAVPIVAQRYLLRQALLHFGLAILERVPRDGTLEIRLERLPARARLRIAAGARPGLAAAHQAIAVPATTPATAASAVSAGPAASTAPAATVPPAARSAAATASAASAASIASAAASPTATAASGAATAASGAAAAPAPAITAAAAASAAPAPRVSAAGTDAREQVAHAIVAAFGGTSWPADPHGDWAFEIEFPLADSH
jgi:DNA segregation ATPase FtsK/SpoIIIE, S-DNA-T family